jgi:hypothetical protein
MSDPLVQPADAVDAVDQTASTTVSSTSDPVDPASGAPTAPEPTTTSVDTSVAPTPEPPTTSSVDTSVAPTPAPPTGSGDATLSVDTGSSQDGGASVAGGSTGGVVESTTGTNDVVPQVTTGVDPTAGGTTGVDPTAGGTPQVTTTVDELAPQGDGLSSLGGIDPTMGSLGSQGDALTPIAGVDPVTSATHEVIGGLDPSAAGGLLDPAVPGVDTTGATVGGLDPLLQPISFDAPPNTFELPPSLGQGALDVTPQAGMEQLTDPVLGLPGPSGGGAGSLADAAGGLTQPVVDPTDPLGGALTGAAPGTVVPDPGALPPTGLPDPLGGTGGVTQPVLDPTDPLGGALTGAAPGTVVPDPGALPPTGLPDPLGGASGADLGAHPLLGPPDPAFGPGGPHGIGDSVRSVLDAIANGVSSSAAAHGRIVALALLLGLMAARLSGAVTAFAGYAVAGVGTSIRTGWLTSFGPARCAVVNAARIASLPFASASLSPPLSPRGRAAAPSVRERIGGVLGVTAGPLAPFHRTLGPFPGRGRLEGIVGAAPGTGFGRFLRLLLIAAGGLLAVAALQARALARRHLPLMMERMSLLLAVIGVSMLIGVGVVLLLTV